MRHLAPGHLLFVIVLGLGFGLAGSATDAAASPPPGLRDESDYVTGKHGDPVTGLRIKLGEVLGKTGTEIADALKEGSPSIWVRAQADAIILSTVTIVDGDEQDIAKKLGPLLSK